MKISFEERYFKFNRIILLAVGLWPYEQTKFARFQVILFFGILISSIVFQVYQYKIYCIIGDSIYSIYNILFNSNNTFLIP